MQLSWKMQMTTSWKRGMDVLLMHHLRFLTQTQSTLVVHPIAGLWEWSCIPCLLVVTPSMMLIHQSSWEKSGEDSFTFLCPSHPSYESSFTPSFEKIPVNEWPPKNFWILSYSALNGCRHCRPQLALLSHHIQFRPSCHLNRLGSNHCHSQQMLTKKWHVFYFQFGLINESPRHPRTRWLHLIFPSALTLLVTHATFIYLITHSTSLVMMLTHKFNNTNVNTHKKLHIHETDQKCMSLSLLLRLVVIKTVTLLILKYSMYSITERKRSFIIWSVISWSFGKFHITPLDSSISTWVGKRLGEG